ncbi:MULTISPECIES: nuclear transport factor 2 family protein [unclassified Streptomyces]|uniref:nuclear transport factor 2 family protein n=1 Tax=unclassified Streptomyces TaxID=2593676 RepID=UPI002E29FC0B|nr:nuclear transport factor 2 family protein [Streptomyces sp. NBC_01423]WSX94034.1 nuclear transport factor 2 family protein [Streptomyces sp. NBC_00891]WSY08511.1 nuclear transport factor 2 family protein [Streptomyces sp. NBC_00890]WSZ10134.1 nuclear transport factor 2 family protein [Streptomyces sp. NBC_00869]WSZ22363.1 nuclear transport factor 2 family protein [Streptomyces sp. NBC_00870]
MTEPAPGVAAAIEGELRLLDPLVRASAELLDQVLHPDYREVDSTGRHWDRSTIIDLLVSGLAPGPGRLTASRMSGVHLADELVHVTFDTEAKGRRAHRSSLWRRTAAGWLLYYHQATPFDATPEG